MMSASPVAVIDSNLALHQVLATPLSELAARAWESFQRQQFSLFAPRLWHYEVTSVINSYLFSGALTPEEARQVLQVAFNLAIRLVDEDEALCISAFEWATLLKRRPAYDCFYLALAEQMQVELWTADEKLYHAAHQPWVRWIGEA